LSRSKQTFLVSVLVDWWDENVRRLEKLRDDGFDARVNEAIDPIVAERMAYEWKVIGKQYTWYSSKVRIYAPGSEAPLNQ
jgi:hypothetical protein